MKNIINKLFITIFAIIVLLPLIFVSLRIKVDSKFSKHQIDANFESNFPLKEDMFKIFFYIKEDLFGVNAIPDKVIDFKNGWLFGGDHWSDNFSESMRYVNFKSDELTTLEKNIKQKQIWCSKQKIKYFIAVAPNKETIYRELIPLDVGSKISKMEQTQNICLKNGVGYIDLGKQFPKDKFSNLLYHKTDTHWTELAGYYAYLEILNQINKQLNFNILPIPLSNFKVEKSDVIIGDLNEIRGKVTNENLLVMKPVNFELKYKEVGKKLEIPSPYENDPNLYERRMISENNLKIMLLHDSFGGYMTKFLCNHFGEVLHIWKHEFNQDLIQKEKPDIIIQEFVERNVDFLLDPQN